MTDTVNKIDSDYCANCNNPLLYPDKPCPCCGYKIYAEPNPKSIKMNLWQPPVISGIKKIVSYIINYLTYLKKPIINYLNWVFKKAPKLEDTKNTQEVHKKIKNGQQKINENEKKEIKFRVHLIIVFISFGIVIWLIFNFLNPKPLKCDDQNVKEMVKTIFSQEFNREGLHQIMLYFLDFSEKYSSSELTNIVSNGYDKKAQKYTCSGQLNIYGKRNGSSVKKTCLIDFSTQLTADKSSCMTKAQFLWANCR